MTRLLAALLTGAVVLAGTGCNQAPAESATTATPAPDVRVSDAPPRAVTLSADLPTPVVPTSQPAIQATGAPPIEFDPPILDFGTIMPNENVEGDFVLRNVGDTPIRIERASTSCQCTQLTPVDGRVISPGGSLTLHVGINGRPTTGVRRESAKFIFEGYAQFIPYNLIGEVTMPVRVAPSIFNLVGGELTGHVAVESLDQRPFNILSANGTTPLFLDYDPDIDEPRNSYMLEWDLTGVPEDQLPRWWIIETDHPDCPVLDTWIRHPVNVKSWQGRRWYVKERRVNLARLEPAQTERFTITIANMPAGTSVYTVRSLSAQFDAELENVVTTSQGTECTVRIDLDPSKRGLVHGLIEVIAGTGSAKIDIIGKVMEG